MLLFTEKQLWCACLKGDSRAFDRFYTIYYPLLYNYGCKFTSDKDLVRDCIQNLFVKLIQSHKSLSDTPSVKGYMLRAFRNHLYDALRSKTVHNELFQPCIDSILNFEQNSFLCITEDEESENIDAVRHAFRKLSPRQQEIIYLYYIADASHKEIAVTLNINYQSSKNLLHRSLDQLKTLFHQERGTDKEKINIEETLKIDLREYQSSPSPY